MLLFFIGFQKRKAERKQKAKNELKEKQREEKILLRQKQREKMRELAQSQGTVPEVQQLIEEEGETVTYELPKQVVSITTFDAKQISGSLGMSLGHNTNKAKTNQDNEQSD